MRSRRLVAIALVGVLALSACSTDDPPPMHPTAGAAGAGDPYYPGDGNGGYDALDYHVGVGYDPASGRLDGDTTVTAKATQDLSRFDLDLRGLDVQSVEIDGGPAKFSRDKALKLVVTPPSPLRAGTTFHTRVRYGGDPSKTAHEGASENGWSRSADGGAYMVGEPHSAAFWFPVNETPRDKATFTLTAHVPAGWTVISNGREQGSSTTAGKTTSTWTEPNPIASYLTTIAIDKFTVERSTLPDGTPVVSAYAPGAEAREGTGSQLPDVLAFLAGKFGPYPQSAAGGIYLDEDIHFSLETQTRPTYAKWAELLTLVHENAHQWFGDSVSLDSWSDICLNECFASYAQWLWAEREGQNLDDRYRAAVEITHDSTDFWSQKLTGMGAGHEFEGVYDKGILAMHALRRRMGETAFDRLLHEWPAEHRHGNATWDQFEQLVSKVSGQNLTAFVDDWFRGAKRPDDADLYPGSLRS
ncbi:M1 family metallopeptidase [Amycolatopsis saalfeldensis]|uniref:Aminopeptidase N n=1 Tax=Amycolatopsis saalfeldensis TaxID=394193 RepID=A0A1H8WBP5_9PSEU|nr:M1 family metallopeptidase [Amycolatopsis saalfeldensis]SEP25051.1 Peptidase family M1 [Amycolatopsis saalfeldensis]